MLNSVQVIENQMTFKEMYCKLVDEVKEEYINSEYVQSIDVDQNMYNLNVSEVFTELDLISWEYTCIGSESNPFTWDNEVSSIIDESIIDEIIINMSDYFETMKDYEV